MDFEAACRQLSEPFAAEAARAAGVMWAKVGAYPHWPVRDGPLLLLL